MTTTLHLPPLITDYLRHLADDLHRAPATVAGVRDELGLIVKRSISLTREDLGAHLTRLPDGRQVAATSRNRRLTILRGFVRFLRQRGELAENPLSGVRPAKVPRRLREAVTAAEVERIVEALRCDPRGARRTRDAALLFLLYYTGLRLSEVARLNVDQVDLGAGVLRAALRKGGDRTDVMLHPRLAAQLALWLEARGTPDTRALFPAGNTRRLRVRAIQLRIQRMGEHAGLRTPLHPHALRHAHATGLLRVGVSTAVIQLSMNHHSIATTERYLHGDLGLVREALARLPSLRVVGPDA